METVNVKFPVYRMLGNPWSYRIAGGKIGGEFNLVVCRSPTATPNLISAELTSAISARKNYVLTFCFAIANRQNLNSADI